MTPDYKMPPEIIEEFGILSTSKAGWCLELNRVAWGHHNPKYDLRTWSPDHLVAGKGLTLTDSELKNLYDILKDIFE